MVPAAEYLRMSTEHQKYSIENQQAAIAEFARKHGLGVVKTYSDLAQSGLQLKRRVGLRQLLRDVISRQVRYRVILVLDVSRWGRFQDDDEAACYEFLCRNSGVSVVYCAEDFPNDGSVASSILKNLSRAQARQFSRDLSIRVFAAKAFVVQRGFWVGGPAPFGYSRMIVANDDPARNRILRHGQRKYRSTDRVILVPGPPQDVFLLRKIFSMAARSKLGTGRIAAKLNEQGYTNHGGPWVSGSIYRILMNPVYTGSNVWNRTSCKLGTCTIRIPPEKWLGKPGAFAPLVSQRIFDGARQALKRLRTSNKWNRQRILSSLQECLRKEGSLSEEILARSSATPASGTIRRHFGTVLNAYKLIGYHPIANSAQSIQALRHTIALRKKLVREVSGLFSGEATLSHSNYRPRLHLSNNVAISILIAPVVYTESRKIRWVVNPHQYERDHSVLLCLASPTSDEFYGFYLFPAFDLQTHHRVFEGDPWLLTGRKLTGLPELREAAKTLVPSAS